MLPFFAMSSAAEPADVPPPSYFRPVVGEIRNASLLDFGHYYRQHGNTTSREAGLRYEAQVQEFLQNELKDAYYPSPLLKFADDTGERRLVPDGLWVVPKLWIVIVEIKAQHTPNAWHQTRQYEQLIQHITRVPKDCILHLEIVRSYDPATPFPVKIELVDSFEEWQKAPPYYGVMRWRKS